MGDIDPADWNVTLKQLAELKAEVKQAATEMAKYAYFNGADDESPDGYWNDIYVTIVYKQDGIYINENRDYADHFAMSYTPVKAGIKVILDTVGVGLGYDPITGRPEVVVGFGDSESSYDRIRSIPYKDIKFVKNTPDFKGIDYEDVGNNDNWIEARPNYD